MHECNYELHIKHSLCIYPNTNVHVRLYVKREDMHIFAECAYRKVRRKSNQILHGTNWHYTEVFYVKYIDLNVFFVYSLLVSVNGGIVLRLGQRECGKSMPTRRNVQRGTTNLPHTLHDAPRIPICTFRISQTLSFSTDQKRHLGELFNGRT